MTIQELIRERAEELQEKAKAAGLETDLEPQTELEIYEAYIRQKEEEKG